MNVYRIFSYCRDNITKVLRKKTLEVTSRKRFFPKADAPISIRSYGLSENSNFLFPKKLGKPNTIFP
ncbi:hypothetical protein [Leptospira santarosai]|uniref:hypothetical protein n=1 Tax=Leptospira santarosai TaxID=28183 RepID=UPI0009E2AA5C